METISSLLPDLVDDLVEVTVESNVVLIVSVVVAVEELNVDLVVAVNGVTVVLCIEFLSSASTSMSELPTKSYHDVDKTIYLGENHLKL